MVLQYAGRWALSGRVVGPAGETVADAEVFLYRVYDFGDGEVDYDYVDEIEAGSTGAYRFNAVRGNRSYAIAASAPGRVRNWLGGNTDRDHVVMTADASVADIVLARSSTVSGVVSGPNGPVGDVEVELYLWNEGDSEFEDWDSDYTEDDGSYRLDVTEPGYYTLHFDGSDATAAVASSWLGGANRPTDTTSAGVFEITTTPTDLVRNKSLPKAQSANGQLVDAGTGSGVPGRVITYVWDDDPDDPSWSQHSATSSDATGNFQVRVPSSSVVTFGYGAHGYHPRFLGGGNELPDAPTSTNSVQVPASADVSLGRLDLTPRPSTFGDVAGQELTYCRTNVLEANDDGSTDAVEIPFDLSFYGNVFDELLREQQRQRDLRCGSRRIHA